MFKVINVIITFIGKSNKNIVYNIPNNEEVEEAIICFVRSVVLCTVNRQNKSFM